MVKGEEGDRRRRGIGKERDGKRRGRG
jgi:hypothetical protein